jgi:hypothetical protein
MSVLSVIREIDLSQVLPANLQNMDVISALKGREGAFPVVPVAAAVTLSVLVYRTLQIGKRDPRMPPGPPTVPILGNAHQIPVTGLYKQYVPLAVFNALRDQTASE